MVDLARYWRLARAVSAEARNRLRGRRTSPIVQVRLDRGQRIIAHTTPRRDLQGAFHPLSAVCAAVKQKSKRNSEVPSRADPIQSIFLLRACGTSFGTSQMTMTGQ